MVLKSGQDRKIASLTKFTYVHFFNGVILMQQKFMQMAIEEAKLALNEGEIPVGAIIVKDNEILACAHNQKEKKCDATKHAEMIAISNASSKIKNWRLNDCDIYISLFPCPMCASAIQQARIRTVYYALKSNDKISTEAVEKIFSGSKTNKSVENHQIFLEKDSLKMLQSFFQKKR